jgi:maltose O-acetyltransferase
MTAPPPPDDQRTQLERMIAGDLYLGGDREVVDAHRRARRLMERFNNAAFDSADERHRILHELLGAFGEGSEVRPPLYCDYGSNLRIGARTFVNFGLMALDPAPISIGDDVQIGPNVQLLTPTHPLDPQLRRAKWEAAKPIDVADNVWLGGGVIVLPGVRIAENTVVGAGAVVTRDLPADVVAAGNPARVIRQL